MLLRITLGWAYIPLLRSLLPKKTGRRDGTQWQSRPYIHLLLLNYAEMQFILKRTKSNCLQLPPPVPFYIGSLCLHICEGRHIRVGGRPFAKFKWGNIFGCCQKYLPKPCWVLRWRSGCLKWNRHNHRSLDRDGFCKKKRRKGTKLIDLKMCWMGRAPKGRSRWAVQEYLLIINFAKLNHDNIIFFSRAGWCTWAATPLRGRWNGRTEWGISYPSFAQNNSDLQRLIP